MTCMLLTTIMEAWEEVIVSRQSTLGKKKRKSAHTENVDTAYAQNPHTKDWYHFDDSHVNKVSVDDIKVSSTQVALDFLTNIIFLDKRCIFIIL